MGPDTTTVKLGLRFRKGQARVLRAVSQQLASNGIRSEHTELFDKAADSAEAGEPLIVIARNRTEVELMAAGFAQFGCARPAIEQLSGLA